MIIFLGVFKIFHTCPTSCICYRGHITCDKIYGSISFNEDFIKSIIFMNSIIVNFDFIQNLYHRGIFANIAFDKSTFIICQDYFIIKQTYKAMNLSSLQCGELH